MSLSVLWLSPSLLIPPSVVNSVSLQTGHDSGRDEDAVVLQYLFDMGELSRFPCILLERRLQSLVCAPWFATLFLPGSEYL